MSIKQRSITRSVLTALAVVTASVAFTACTTTTPGNTQTASERGGTIDTRADATLQRLYDTVPESRRIIANSKGVLIFPSVLKAGLIIGGEHGDGVLRVNGRNEGYYSTTSASIGLQAGAQTKAMVIAFQTAEALAKFRASDGWTVGADATVAVANVGANGVVDSNTLNQPVVAFVMTNAGLMAGVSLEGTKITRMADRPK